MKKPLITLAVLLFASSTFAEVYKWVDANGKTHYGDEHEADTNTAEKVEPKPSNTFSAKEAMTDEMRAALEASTQKRHAEEAAAKEQEQAAKEKADKEKADAEAAEKERLAERKRRYGY